MARRADIDPAVVTRQTRALEDTGMISRSRDTDDGRLSSLTATDLGHQTVERMRRVLGQHMELALQGWDHTDLALLADLLERLAGDLRAIPYPELPPP